MANLQNAREPPPDLPHQLRAVAAALGDAKTFADDAAYLREWADRVDKREQAETDRGR